VSFIKHGHDCDVTADVALRIDALEDLLNENTDLRNVERKKKIHSLGAELGNIADGRQRRWTLATEEDTPRVAGSMVSAFESIGLPYLETFSDLNRALAVLAADDRSSWLHSPFHDLRAKRAVGLAHLLGRPAEELDVLIAAKTKFLGERSDPGVESFLVFAKSIRDRALATPPAPAGRRAER